jgi:hypothetical protein
VPLLGCPFLSGFALFAVAVVLIKTHLSTGTESPSSRDDLGKKRDQSGLGI